MRNYMIVGAGQCRCRAVHSINALVVCWSCTTGGGQGCGMCDCFRMRPDAFYSMRDTVVIWKMDVVHHSVPVTVSLCCTRHHINHSRSCNAIEGVDLFLQHATSIQLFPLSGKCPGVALIASCVGTKARIFCFCSHRVHRHPHVRDIRRIAIHAPAFHAESAHTTRCSRSLRLR